MDQISTCSVSKQIMSTNNETLSGEDVLYEGTIALDSFMEASSACDKLLNCAYDRKQLEEEWKEEKLVNESAVGRVLRRLERSCEVDVYKQLLFNESSICASDDE
mmetsp:Transcript_31948/g.35402  ORF Transcript_31948/g.35402 Transcript_31948/m.35402 type:complete len:105 (+) Transcript_31948:132-446(+)|eukprot:CAMPEP_0194147398 /NCGR_PEP_ID=MMETSP0152-20130528/24190_1 /TAXON_ID=1049557 /ORGANISM="Thalassiothrix antarctica, Strain L6-D1" /LENGTH=104 /DNA_ID=CAMNT_0038848209 /DNA_START=68 /DNA_END=382 /DNA_ORIENTATION=-